MDPESETLRLSGPREHVINVLTEFYRVKAEKQEENYIALIARHVVWGFLTTSNTYEKYSLKINARIEDAYQAQKPVVCKRIFNYRI